MKKHMGYNRLLAGELYEFSLGIDPAAFASVNIAPDDARNQEGYALDMDEVMEHLRT